MIVWYDIRKRRNLPCCVLTRFGWRWVRRGKTTRAGRNDPNSSARAHSHVINSSVHFSCKTLIKTLPRLLLHFNRFRDSGASAMSNCLLFENKVYKGYDFTSFSALLKFVFAILVIIVYVNDFYALSHCRFCLLSELDNCF